MIFSSFGRNQLRSASHTFLFSKLYLYNLSGEKSSKVKLSRSEFFSEIFGLSQNTGSDIISLCIQRFVKYF